MTGRRLMQVKKVQNIPIHIPTDRELFQYWIIRPEVVNSRAYVIAQENQYIQPMAKPRVGDTKREAKTVKAP